MKKVVFTITCAGLLLALNGINANAAKTSSTKATKKTAEKTADSMQCQEIKLTGLVSEKEVKTPDGKSTKKAFVLTDPKGKDWELPTNKNIKFPEFDGLKVKAVCMAMGSKVLSTKTMEALDKTAYTAKVAAIEAAKKEAEAAKKAAAEAAKKK